MKWRRKMGINGSAASKAVILSLVVILSAGDVFTQTAEEQASQVYDTTNQQYGSTGAVQNNAVAPVVSSGTPMKTVDGSGTFNAQITCPSSSKMVEIDILPGGTGDISSIIIQQDINYSNTFNYTYSPAMLVSGVCANGIISCDAATWNHCKFYTWTAAADGRVSLNQETNITSLGGCYCINNSCGSNLTVLQRANILQSLGGGVVSAIQAVKPQQAISNASIQDLSITYYGQSSSGCTAAAAGSGSGNPQAYYNPRDASSLDNTVESTTTGQKADPNSTYSTLLSSSASYSASATVNTCTILNDAYVTTAHVPTTNPIPFTFYGAADDWYYLYMDGNLILQCPVWDWTCEGYRSVTVNVTPGIHQIHLVGMNWGSCDVRWVAFAAQNNADSSWPLLSGANKGWTGEVDIFWGGGALPNPAAQFMWWSGVCGGSMYADNTFNAEFIVPQDTLHDPVVTNNCTELESNPSCYLRDEVVDNVQTFQNYKPTRLTPLPSCKDIVGATQIFHVCHPWWVKKRTYFCTGDTQDWSDMKKRVGNIHNTTTDNTTNIFYSDITKDNAGVWNPSADQVAIDTRGNPDNCTKACKTRKSSQNTQAGTSGNASQYQINTATYQYFYKYCGLNNTCPLDTGEELLADCKCQNDFLAATAGMAAMDAAAKDLICSSVTTTP